MLLLVVLMVPTTASVARAQEDERVTITFNKQEARLLPNHMITLTATCSPATTQELTATSSNTAVAVPVVDNRTIYVKGIAEGTATITVSTADGWCYPAECVITVFTELGDVNCDGIINIADVVALIDYLLDESSQPFSASNADTDRNGIVNISDVTALIDYLLTGTWLWDEPAS